MLICYLRLEEIERNKRPPGCEVVHDWDRKATIRTLELERRKLEEQLEKMPVSLFTERAKQQRNQLIARLEEVESGLKVFTRKKVLVASGSY